MVFCGAIDGGGDGRDLFEETVDLGLNGAGVGFAFVEAGLKFVSTHAESAVDGEAADHVVGVRLTVAVGLGSGDGVLFNDFVGGLATDPVFDGGHHDGGAEKEGEVVLILTLDDGGVGVHLIQNGDHGFKESVDGEEGVGQHDAADDGAGDIALVPLIAGEAGCHGEVAAENGLEAVDALATAAVHFVWHGGGTDLAFGEAFTGEFVSGHEADRLGEAGRAGSDPIERGCEGRPGRRW